MKIVEQTEVDDSLSYDMIFYGTAFVRLYTDPQGNLLRERLDPEIMMEKYQELFGDKNGKQ